MILLSHRFTKPSRGKDLCLKKVFHSFLAFLLMPVTRDLLLFIAYHPSRKEVANLESCLAKLPTNIGYAVVVNDYAPGEPVDSLAPNSDKFITFQENIGYGRAANCLFAQLDTSPPYIAVLNTDIFWNSGTFAYSVDQFKSWAVYLLVPNFK